MPRPVNLLSLLRSIRSLTSNPAVKHKYTGFFDMSVPSAATAKSAGAIQEQILNSLTPDGQVPKEISRIQNDAVEEYLYDQGRPKPNDKVNELKKDVQVRNVPNAAESSEMRKAILHRLAMVTARSSARSGAQSKASNKKLRYQLEEKAELQRLLEALKYEELEIQKRPGYDPNGPQPKVTLSALRRRLPSTFMAPAPPAESLPEVEAAGSGRIIKTTAMQLENVEMGLDSLPPNNYVRLAANSIIAQELQAQAEEQAEKSPWRQIQDQNQHQLPVKRQYNTRSTRASKPRDPIVMPSADSLGVPEPTSTYLEKMQQLPEQGVFQQPLLLVIDLNGTLLYRPNRSGAPSRFVARPAADKFIRYAIANFKVMIWSSARPSNVDRMCQNLIPPELRRELVAEWSRQHLGLSPADYERRVQVYKRLTSVWTNRAVQGHHPYHTWEWNQSNTVLIDDSMEKGRSEPGNVLVIPEFAGDMDENPPVLDKLIDYLEILRYQKDVSCFISRHRLGGPLPPFQRPETVSEILRSAA